MSEQIKAGAPIGNQNAKKTTYHKGDLAEYTGETRDIAGGKFHVLKILEGHREGKEELTQRGPDGSDPYVDQSQADWKKQQEEFARLHATEAVTDGDLVTASDAIRGRAQAFAPKAQWKQGEEVTFTFMPKGTHTINAGFRGKTINLTVQVDKSTTNAVQASLDKQRSMKPKQKPYGCVEHREQEASVIAHGFRWSDDEGVLIAAEPTALGERNVNGKIHWSWSPSFFTDADYAKAKEAGGVWTFPNGVRGSSSNPARVTGVAFCVGTLTNNPAFHEMPPVKASEGAEAVTAGAPAGNQNAAGAHKRKTYQQHLDNCNRLGTCAEAASTKADEGHEREHHINAAKAHFAAEDAHHEAAHEATVTGMPSSQMHHSSMARHHAEMGDGHNRIADSMSTARATNATETDAVQAGAPQGNKNALGKHHKKICDFADSFSSTPKDWSEATDELPDLHNKLAEHVPDYKGATFQSAGGTMPDDVRDTPAKRNQYHKAQIKKLVPKLDDEQAERIAKNTDYLQASTKPTTDAILARLGSKASATDTVLASVRKRQLGIEDKVTAGGTSDGAKKGWEHRLGGHLTDAMDYHREAGHGENFESVRNPANKAGTAAILAGHIAHQEGSKSSHETAAEAHSEASGAHMKAMHAAAQEGNHVMRRYHASQARFHTEEERQHDHLSGRSPTKKMTDEEYEKRSYQPDTTRASDQQQDDAVQAAQGAFAAGHPFYGNKYSQVATKASFQAGVHKDAAHHNDAAEAHMNAAQDHMKTARTFPAQSEERKTILEAATHHIEQHNKHAQKAADAASEHKNQEVRSQNEGYGFHGAAQESALREAHGNDYEPHKLSEDNRRGASKQAANAFSRAANDLVAHGHFDDHKQAGDFLDSRMGRHIGDQTGHGGSVNEVGWLRSTVKDYKKAMSQEGRRSHWNAKAAEAATRKP